MRTRVDTWLQDLRRTPAPRGALSAEGAALVWGDALDALHPAALDAATAIEGPGWPSVGMAVPRTVPTAPLEWCAVALARGASVVLKAPADDPAPALFLGATAAARGLPLTVTTDRAALSDPALVVVMGDDATITAVRAARGGRPVLGFGHRVSAAWITSTDGVAALVDDLVRFDGRGCMSPVAVVTPLAPDVVADALAGAMSAMAARVPRGELDPIEGARLRLRFARDRVAGRLREGPGWGVSTADTLPDEALPRWVPVVYAPDAASALAAIDVAHLSTVGTDDPALAAPPHVRVCALGAMQRPPLVRLHDGVDWLRCLAGPT